MREGSWDCPNFPCENNTLSRQTLWHDPRQSYAEARLLRGVSAMGFFSHTAISLTAAVGCAVVTPAVAAATAQSAGTPCGSSAAACVSLGSQRAWLMSGGQVMYGPTPITSGKPGERTPPGMFRVLWKDKDHRSSIFNNAPMPYSVFFTNTGIAFHEGSLRSPSAGCIHLSHSAAQTFFNTLKVGQVVQVVN
jgi:hypothetical protein